jgi:hypothetical protein
MNHLVGFNVDFPTIKSHQNLFCVLEVEHVQFAACRQIDMVIIVL